MHLDREITNFIKDTGFDISKMDIYHFGIWSGNSMIRFQDELIRKKMIPRQIWGFDSFQGLPAEAPGVKVYEGHKKGEYNTVKDMKARSIKNAVGLVLNKCPLKEKTKIKTGYFKNVLSAELIKEEDFAPAAYIEMDVDLYISCSQVLEWMTRHGLITKGTIIYYDDWGGVPQYKGGESLAHKEWIKKWDIKCKRLLDIGDGRPHRHVIMRVQ